jgi:iron(III) transport system permease protein
MRPPARDSELTSRHPTILRHGYRNLAAYLVAAVHGLVIIASLAGPALILADTFVHHGHLSLVAWRNVFGNWDRWETLLANTGVVAVFALVPACAVGIVFAGLLLRMDVRGRLLGIGLLLFAAAVPLYVVNGAVISIIGLDSLRGSAAAVGLIHAGAHLPIVVIMIGIALRSVPAATEECALADGVGTFQVFFRITLPQAIGGVMAAVIVVLLWVTADYSVSDILMVRTFAEEVYTQYALHGRPQEPALVCLPQIVLLGGLLWALRRFYLTGTDASPTAHITHEFKTGRWRTPLSLVAVALPLAVVTTLLAALVAPLRRAPDAMYVASWFVEEVTTSLIAGAAAGIISAGLGIGLAWYIVRRTRWRLVLAAYVVAMLAIPAPVLGMGMIRLFNRPGLSGWFYDSPAILTAAYVFRFLPIAVILLIPAVRAIPVECELAAKVDGCTELGVCYRIVWPQCTHMALVAVFIVTVLAIGELPCSLLVTPPGFITVGARFFSLVHYGMYPDAAMLCLLSIGSVVLPTAALFLLLKRRLTG